MKRSFYRESDKNYINLKIKNLYDKNFMSKYFYLLFRFENTTLIHLLTLRCCESK